MPDIWFGMEAGIFNMRSMMSSGIDTPQARATDVASCTALATTSLVPSTSSIGPSEISATAESALKAQLMISLLHSVTSISSAIVAWMPGPARKRLHQRFARGRGTDGEVAAAVMPDMAGPGHLAADIDHHGTNGVAAGDRGKTRRIVDAVLQAENECFRQQASGERPAGLLGIGRLHANQHQIGRGKRGCVGRGFGGQVAVESLGVQQQAMGVDGIDMRLPADERHVLPGPQQQPPIAASYCSGPDRPRRFACSSPVRLALRLTVWSLTIN